MSPNEVRDLEDMNPREGGDEFANPAIDTSKGGESDANQPTEPEGPGLPDVPTEGDED
jgi:hypothetical protein